MNKFLDISFGLIYQFYLKYGDFDAYYHTAFVQGVLLASSINFLREMAYYFTKNPIFKFSLYPVGVMLVIVIASVVFYFHRNKNYYVDSNERLSKVLTKDDWIVIMIMGIMFSTWFITPFINV